VTESNPKIFTTILRDLERAFFAQLSRLKDKPAPHSVGFKKPSLDETEARLLGEPDGEEED